MIPVNYDKVELKYMVDYINEPSKYDLLFEIANFLTQENKDEFNEWELKNKTKYRFGTLEENFQILVDEGFIEKSKYTKYKLVKHLWQ